MRDHRGGDHAQKQPAEGLRQGLVLARRVPAGFRAARRSTGRAGQGNPGSRCQGTGGATTSAPLAGTGHMKTPAFFQRSPLTQVLWSFRREFLLVGFFSAVANLLM